MSEPTDALPEIVETLRRDVSSLAMQVEMQAKSIMMLSQTVTRMLSINQNTSKAFNETVTIVKDLQDKLSLMATGQSLPS